MAVDVGMKGSKAAISNEEGDQESEVTMAGEREDIMYMMMGDEQDLISGH